MDDILATLAEHPVAIAAYRSIRFVKRNDHGRPIYRVRNMEVGGAEKSMRAAHAHYGSSCFYCGKVMPTDAPPELFTLDHVCPESGGGTDALHNLVFCCRPCNVRKADKPVAEFHPERAADYAQALDRHYLRCLAAVTGRPVQPAVAAVA